MTITELTGRILGAAQVLETVDVRGKRNCQVLGGCIEYLERLANEIKEDAEGAINHESSEG